MHKMEQAADYPGSSQGELSAVGTAAEQAQAIGHLREWLTEYLIVCGVPDDGVLDEYVERSLWATDQFIDNVMRGEA